MNKNSKRERKQLCLNLPIEVYKQLEEKAARRELDKTNYITYLVQNDADDMFSKNASKALNNILYSTERLLNNVSEDNKIKPFVIDIKNGVNELWRYLR